MSDKVLKAEVQKLIAHCVDPLEDCVYGLQCSEGNGWHSCQDGGNFKARHKACHILESMAGSLVNLTDPKLNRFTPILSLIL